MTWLHRLASLLHCPHEHSMRERVDGVYRLVCVCCGHAVPALELDQELREKRGRLSERMQRNGKSTVVAMTPRRRA